MEVDTQSLAENLCGPFEHLKWNMSAGRIKGKWQA
jgi:hypothetical protein